MKRIVASTVLLTFLTTSCGGKKATPPPEGDGSGTKADKPFVLNKDAPDGLDLRLTEGKQGAPAYDRAKLGTATKLADTEATQLLSRAKPITVDAQDKQDFALRPKSQPPPKTGQTITGAFPPPASSLLPPKASDEGKALEVLRYMPEGEVPLAPELSVTFSQPMVAVTSQTDASATTPVKLTPQPKGNWRWLGTRTVLFDPEIRFPQATTYTVEVPAGTKSANGGALAKATKFTFETPAPTIVSSYPTGGPYRRDVPMFVLFDQKIDPSALIQRINVTSSAGRASLQLLDQKDIAKNTQIASMVEAANKNEQAGRWIAFRAVGELPGDTTITVEIPKGTPSAEGPNTTKGPQSFSFQTYPPLRIDEARCGWGSECRPGMPFQIRFNNPLDMDAFEEGNFTISPEIPGVKILPQSSYVMVQGLTKARTKYTVVISEKVKDEFGQTLGKSDTRSFNVGDAQPTFFGPNGLVVLDPIATKPTLDFFSTNYDQLKVRLYKVTPADYDAYGFYMRNQWNKDKPAPIPGTKVVDKMVKTTIGRNDLVETSVDLSQALTNGAGHVLAIVEPFPWREQYEPPRMISWVQATKIAVDAAVDGDDLRAFVTDLATGKPASGVDLEIRPFGTTAKTDDKGVATIPLTTASKTGANYLVAKKGNDVAFVAEDSGWWRDNGSWTKQNREKVLAWYVVDDRKMYKPGEEVTLKGWLRVLDTAKGGDINGVSDQVSTVTYEVTDSQGNKIANGTAPVAITGGFDTKFTLPKTPNLGYTQIRFLATGRMSGDYYHSINVEEFRRPEFEVSAQASQGPFLVGEGGDVTVTAKYYSGGPLPGATTNWYVTASQTSFTPPNREDYTFGAWTPWWSYRSYDDYDDEGGYRYGGYKPPKSWTLEGKTDATGAHTAHMDFLSAKPTVPMSVSATARVMDVNRQEWSASATMLVHPSSAYVGLKPAKPFVEKDAPFEMDVIGVDLDGKSIDGAKIDVKSVRLDWTYEKGRYKTKEVDPQACTVTAASAASHCTFKTATGGTYQVTATITDAKGRPNQTTMTYWVSGGDQPAAREVAQEQVQLIPDKKEYADGNTAEVLVQAPFYPAEGVVSWRRSGIVKTERITMQGPTMVLKVPITDTMVPNLFVQVDLVGAAARTDDKGLPDPKLPKRPAYAVGQLNLPVPPKKRTLAVSVTPSAAKIAPGDAAKLAIEVKDASGTPVADAEAAVFVVDEAILSLTGYQFPDPVGGFYGGRGPDARDHYMRAYVKLAKPDATKLADSTNAAPGGGAPTPDMAMPKPAAPAMAEAAPMEMAKEAKADKKPEPARRMRAESEKNLDQDGKDSGGESAASAIAIRSNFNPLAAFAPSVKTDASGKATVDIKVPDNLTRYRIIAIAVAGERQFGKGESAVTARLPLMVRPSPPRFLNFGDTFQLPVVVQNQTDSAMQVKVAIRTTNATITDGAGRMVSVPANDRVEVLFPAAAEMAGTARFQVVGSVGSYSDAAELALPVWTPATTEAFATYGVIDDGAMKQPIALPGQVVTQFGGLEVSTASTNLQALTDAFLYLVHYPFECAEQRSSRVLSIAALRDVLSAFKTKDMPSAAEMSTSVDKDVERLSQMQNGDGGFAYWERGRPSEPYLTVYVASALQHAKLKGFTIPQAILDRARDYLRSIEEHYPHYYPADVRRTISAYALYTRKQMGDLDVAKAKRLFAEVAIDKHNMETLGWILGTIAQQPAATPERAAIVRHATNRVSETAGAANFVTSYADGGHLLLASDHRVDAIMLESLIQEQKTSDLIPKIVTGLLAHRKAGRWLNTQENTFALLALDLYFQTYEKITPNFVARIWLGDDYAGDLAFRGRTTDTFAVKIPMKEVAAHDKQDLTIQKDGAGRLYYRIGMTYAPASLKLEPADYGFVVTREYEGVDNKGDVTKDAQGVWHIKAGTRVRVKLTMINENRRYHVALVDPLPAGLEAMNPALAVTGPIPMDPAAQDDKSGPGRYWWWYGPWYEHQNIRDERIEAFAQLLWEGVHRYDYVARATTPGNFVVPPPKAEEMYMPETFGRGASDRVIVE